MHRDPNVIQNFIQQRGYLAIFLLMTLESMFLPFPSEIVMIPAGVYAAKGVLNLALAIAAWVAGSVFGALINYRIALTWGRPLINKMIQKKWLKKEHWQKGEDFFVQNWDVATFVWRLIPVVRQYISFPAWLWKMPLSKFVLFTALGAGIRVTFLALLGYYSYRYLEKNPHLLEQAKTWWSLALILLAVVIVVVKFKLLNKFKNEPKNDSSN